VRFESILEFSDEASPLEIVASCEPKCTCDNPSENFPYSDETFSLIEEMAPEISFYSRKFGVPPIAVAGAIADEYNTQKGVKGILDWFQDDVLLNFMPNFAIDFDAWLGSDSKLFNATKHDLGVGNVKLETAKALYDQHTSTFSEMGWDYTDIVDYLRTRKGTAHMAALYIADAQKELGNLIAPLSQRNKEAVLITYYKQGPTYLDRFLEAKELEPDRIIKPGEGCRVCLQRDRFLDIFPERDDPAPFYWDGLDQKYRHPGATRYA